MSKIKIADFYYGAVLSMLFNRHINPALVEIDDDRRVYDMTTNQSSFRLYIKHRTIGTQTKTEGYNSWQFVFTQKELDELNDYMHNDYNLLLVLVCGARKLSDTEIAILKRDEIEELMRLEKTSISISRKKGERAFRISVGGGREAAMRIETNRFERLFPLRNSPKNV